MKQLQNNFTTPEQSKRLLDLGLPADSADCYYNGDYSRIEVLEQGFCAVRPCWSVGRLIEIWLRLFPEEGFEVYGKHTDCVKVLIDAFYEADSDLFAEYGHHLDFSKLEE